MLHIHAVHDAPVPTEAANDLARLEVVEEDGVVGAADNESRIADVGQGGRSALGESNDAVAAGEGRIAPSAPS